MKRNSVFVVLVLTLLLLGGCSKEQSQLSYIGAEEAKQLALEASGLTASEVEGLTADLTTYNGQDYYQIDFTAAGESYQYDIDALTGVVIEYHSSAEVLESSPVSGTDPGNTDEEIQAAPEDQQAVSSPEPESSANPSAAEMLTADEAKAVALSHAGLSGSQVTFIKSKLDHEDSRRVYEVEFYTQDYTEYEYEIDAYTGEVVSYEYDTGHYLASGFSGSAITADEAKALALAQVPGATVDDITKFEIDYDDGRVEYEGKIVYDGMEYEFEIDGYSSAIRCWRAEHHIGRCWQYSGD